MAESIKTSDYACALFPYISKGGPYRAYVKTGCPDSERIYAGAGLLKMINPTSTSTNGGTMHPDEVKVVGQGNLITVFSSKLVKVMSTAPSGEKGVAELAEHVGFENLKMFVESGGMLSMEAKLCTPPVVQVTKEEANKGMLKVLPQYIKDGVPAPYVYRKDMADPDAGIRDVVKQVQGVLGASHHASDCNMDMAGASSAEALRARTFDYTKWTCLYTWRLKDGNTLTIAKAPYIGVLGFILPAEGATAGK